MRRSVTLIALVIVMVWSALPIYWVLNLSVQPRIDIFSVPAFLVPVHFTLNNYLRALGILTTVEPGVATGLGSVPAFLSGIQNSLVLATAVMFLTLIICVPAGYCFARYSFTLRTAIFSVILFARSLPPISTTIPYYQFYKSVGLLGTFPGMILVHLTLTVPLVTWVLSGFLSSLPAEIDRQGRVDGCNRAQLFRYVIIPMAAPGLASVAILSWLISWNEFVFALLLASVKGLSLLSPAIAAPLFGFATDVEFFTAFIGVSLIPAIIAAVFLQRYMTRLRIADPLTFRAPE